MVVCDASNQRGPLNPHVFKEANQLAKDFQTARNVLQLGLTLQPSTRRARGAEKETGAKRKGGRGFLPVPVLPAHADHALF